MNSLLLAGLLCHLRVGQGSRVIVGQQTDEVRRLLEGLEAFVDFGEEAVGNILAQHHLAGRRRLVCRGGHDDLMRVMYENEVICARDLVDFRGKKIVRLSITDRMPFSAVLADVVEHIYTYAVHE